MHLSSCEMPGVRERVRAAGVPFVPMPGRHPDPADLKTTLGTLDKLSRDGRPWLAIDGYHLDADYQRAVRREGYRLLVLDDFGHQPEYHADILLNQNPGAESLAYRTDAETLLLLGFHYALLRPEFCGRRRLRRDIPEVARKVLITFGGSDPDDMASKALQALQLVDVEGLQAVIVVGTAYAHLDRLQARAAKSRVNIQILRDIQDMRARMEWADVALAAGGSTIAELSYLGLPALLVTLAENQRRGAMAMQALGLGRFAGRARSAAPVELARLLTQLCRDAAFRREAAARGQSMVDGAGARRVVDAMAALDAARLDRAVAVRLAEPEDALDVWRLSNEPGVRANSFAPDPIPLERHMEWFPDQLKRQDVRYWVLTIADTLACQVRYSREDAETAEVHFSVRGAFRGKGLGTLALRRTCGQACTELGVRRVIGHVIAPNEASARAFAKAGFARLADSSAGGRPCMVFELLRSPAARP